MPLPNDERILKLAEDLLAQFAVMFGQHPGYRPAHARGILVRGTFTPTAEARQLSNAPHFLREVTPVTVRFSSSTGLPQIPDTDPNANPRGMAIRFHLAERVHTDIITHSADGFPTRTGEEFLELLKAVSAGEAEKFLAGHPETLKFVTTPKPFPASYVKEKYFGVTAFEFVNAEGSRQMGRFRVVPAAGVEHTDPGGKGSDYLLEELKARLAATAAEFDLQVQLAGPDDVTDNATVQWPETRPLVTIGKLVLTEVVGDDAAEQKYVIFDPIPRVEGINPSADPLLELRAAAYLVSGRHRRSA